VWPEAGAGEGGRRPEVGEDPDKRAPLVCERERGGGGVGRVGRNIAGPAELG
jgi:hypothetical protein